MSTDDDIIELDSEGNFVVPDVPTKDTNRVTIETVEDDDEFVAPVKEQQQQQQQGTEDKQASASEVLDGIAVGEYKIFKYANKVDVIVHLDRQASAISGVTVNTGTLKIAFGGNSSNNGGVGNGNGNGNGNCSTTTATMSIDISDYVSKSSNDTTAAAYSYQDFLSVRFEKE